MPQPTKIPRPFADSGDKNSIPDSSGSIGFASWREGFPAITGTPFAQGGVAPKRADFNGIFNALSAAAIWQQQGGIFGYDVDTDYEIGNLAVESGVLYICKIANGPNSALHAPSSDTDGTYWGRVYPQYGTFNRMFFSQTSGSYTAPVTGIYRITLKAGGGGGSGASTGEYTTGAGGGEGGKIVFYETLIKSQSYPYVIGAGGAAGTNSAVFTGVTGGDQGGTTSFNAQYSVAGGAGGQALHQGGRGGVGGGRTVVKPTGAVVEVTPGQSGQCSLAGSAGNQYISRFALGGGSSTDSGAYLGGGGTGAGFNRAGNQTSPATAGADGYILIEYAG